MFVAVGLHKLHSTGCLYMVIKNEVDKFKSKYYFDNQHLGISMMKLCNTKSYFIKLDQCNQMLESMSNKYKNLDKEIIVLRTTGKHRMSLNFCMLCLRIIYLLQKHVQ